MKSTIAAYLEVGGRRVFAGALDWPGWCRAAREADEALEALAGYEPRYVAALRRTRVEPPHAEEEFRVVERLKGDATTDFGAPGIAPKYDSKPLGAAGLERLT